MVRSGAVYTWGHGHRGQLGHLTYDGSTVKIQAKPKLLDTIETKVGKRGTIGIKVGKGATVDTKVGK